jgi:hypothetical protein
MDEIISETSQEESENYEMRKKESKPAIRYFDPD